MITHKKLLESIARQKKYTFISTGMSTTQEIKEAIELFQKADCPFELMHCNSTYPMKDEEANLRAIPFLRERFNLRTRKCSGEVPQWYTKTNCPECNFS